MGTLLEGLPIQFHPATRELADLAAIYKATHRLSLAAALAKEKKAELVTGDPEFKPLEKESKILWLAGDCTPPPWADRLTLWPRSPVGSTLT